MHFRTNVNYKAYISNCLIEICNTHTITFDYQTFFFSQFTFKLHFGMNCFWLFAVSIRTRSDDGKLRNKNIACFSSSSSRNAALIECKVLHYTTLSIKLHHCTLSEINTPVFTLSDIVACVSIHCVDQKQHSNPDFLTKSVGKMLQTCVELANDYLQTYNTGAGVKNHVFCTLRHCKCAGYTMLLFAFVLSN